MTRNEFLLKAFKESDVYTLTEWVFSIFTVVRDNDIEQLEPYPYAVGTSNGRYYYYLNDDWHLILDSPKTDRPLILVEEAIVVDNQSQMVQKYNSFPLRTRAGTFFINHYLLVYPFQDRIPYQDGEVKVSKLEDLVTPLIRERKDMENNYEQGVVFVDEVKKFSTACAAVASFSSIATPSATKYTMVPPTGLKELRAQLLEKYKDKLHDPAIVAEIEKQLVEHDMRFQAQDPDKGFLQPGKAFSVSRKKLFLLHGYEKSDMQPEADFVENSLSEGWDIKKMPAMINSLRDGSYNRGVKTALGGEAVKFIFRIFSTTRIVEEDCGTKIGMLKTVTSDDVGKTLIDNNGNNITLSSEVIGKYIGQKQIVRSPGFCKSDGAGFCLKCLGEKFRGNENALAALASEVGSDMLNIFMSKMHGSVLATTPWNYKDTIS